MKTSRISLQRSHVTCRTICKVYTFGMPALVCSVLCAVNPLLQGRILGRQRPLEKWKKYTAKRCHHYWLGCWSEWWHWNFCFLYGTCQSFLKFSSYLVHVCSSNSACHTFEACIAKWLQNYNSAKLGASCIEPETGEVEATAQQKVSNMTHVVSQVVFETLCSALPVLGYLCHVVLTSLCSPTSFASFLHCFEEGLHTETNIRKQMRINGSLALDEKTS